MSNEIDNNNELLLTDLDNVCGGADYYCMSAGNAGIVMVHTNWSNHNLVNYDDALRQCLDKVPSGYKEVAMATIKKFTEESKKDTFAGYNSSVYYLNLQTGEYSCEHQQINK